jgi:hypothetical protein
MKVEFNGQYDTIVCSEECEHAVTRAYVYVKKMIPVFFGGMLAGLFLIISGEMIFRSKAALITGFLLLGATLMACPFATPQTTQMLGLKRSFAFGRISGFFFMLVALGFLIALFFR